MISQGFRNYEIESNDFPITFTASTDASRLPDLAEISFKIQDVANGTTTRKRVPFKMNPNKTATLVLTAPPGPCNITFALQVRFPATNPKDKPLNLLFVSADNQKAKDEVMPEDQPIVFANYVMKFR